MELALIDRWLHIIAGVTWIGLLYYLNFVQAQAMGSRSGRRRAGPGPAAIGKYVAPRALLWFRWSALVTWLTGAYYLAVLKIFGAAFMLGIGAESLPITSIGIGAWLGTFMLFNVWVLIWPNQKKILGMVEATDEEKARARRVAFLASRSNVNDVYSDAVVHAKFRSRFAHVI